MTKQIKTSFIKLAAPKSGVAVAFAAEGLGLGAVTAEFLDNMTGGLERAAGIAKFTGKKSSTLDLIAPAGLGVDRLILVGLGKPEDLGGQDWLKLGGTVMGALDSAKASDATVLAEIAAKADLSADALAAFAMGAKLRAYKFDTYKTRKADDDSGPSALKLQIAVSDPRPVKKAWAAADGIADGVYLARDLVNEPPNALGPVEFADKAAALKKLGVEIEILGEKEMKKLKMAALLGVSQGATRPPRLVIMRWNGGKKNEAPLAFVGKGVVFDTGGISIKPAGGMEDMKWDMGGSAAVIGAMRAIAGRNAKANVIGIVGLVENMPSANAQRPGDVVTSLSGQTVEVINTDAEGRLVLCDLLTYVQRTYKPAAIVDLATLTGAIIVSLGHHHAGLFASDDALAEGLATAGKAVGEPCWRMPLGEEYDKALKSDIADMKNVGGRDGGSITAAQFLKRFVDNGTPWAHLDIAGMAWSKEAKPTVPKGGTGYGVRLLDQLVADRFEHR